MRFTSSSLIFFMSTTFNICCSQTILNGDFEKNIATSCEYNIPDSILHTVVENIYGIGKKQVFGNLIGEIDLQTTGCLVTPQHGDWCLGLNSDNIGTSDGIAMELSTNLESGKTYEITFFSFANTVYDSIPAQIEIGESMLDSTFGIRINSFYPVINEWALSSYKFIAAQNAEYITVRNEIGKPGWNQIDNFAIEETLPEIPECGFLKTVKVSPNPVSNSLNVGLEKAIPKGNFTMFNSLGQIVFQKEFDNLKNDIINVQGLSEGVYFLVIGCNQENKVFEFVKINN